MFEIKTRRMYAVVATVQVFLTFLSPNGHAQVSPAAPSYQLPESQDSIFKRWQAGVFFAGGFAPFYSIHSSAAGYDLSVDFFNAGFEGGRLLDKARGPGFLHGRPEALVEIVPFWEASYPKQTVVVHFTNPESGNPTSVKGPFTEYGSTVTPLLLRWNFINEDHPRVMPWAQLGGGLLWTNHKFPLMGGSTSVFNFTPQVGVGTSVFVARHQSLDFGIKAVHISSAGLGDHNPGVNVTLQFSAGYSWWK